MVRCPSFYKLSSVFSKVLFVKGLRSFTIKSSHNVKTRNTNTHTYEIDFFQFPFTRFGNLERNEIELKTMWFESKILNHIAMSASSWDNLTHLKRNIGISVAV